MTRTPLSLPFLSLSAVFVSDSTKVRYFRTRGGPAGPARRALDAALAGRDWPGTGRVTAEIARGAADLADSARRAQDPRLWLAATARLEGLLARLRLGEGSAGDGGSGGAGPGIDEPGGLDAALGAGPTVGDPAEP